MTNLTIKWYVRSATQVRANAERLSNDRGDVSSTMVFIGGVILAAVAVVGILYVKLTGAANAIDLDPGVGAGQPRYFNG